MTPPLIRKILTSNLLWIVARVLLVFVFFASGLSKLLNINGSGYAEMAKASLDPVWFFNYATAFTLLLGAVLILFNRFVWLCAGLISVFLILAIFIVHHFWSLPEPKAQMSMYIALEHISVVGGLIIAAILSEVHTILKERNISL